MAWVHDEIGRSVGLPREVGGIPLDEIGATGWGICNATDVALRYSDFKLAGARVAIQGFGAVGRHSARFLCEQGAVLVAAADTGGTICDPNGLDVNALIALKDAGNSVVEHKKGKVLPAEAVIGVECDIWIPAARPDVVHEDNVHKLKTKVIIEGANIPITRGTEKRLHEQGVLCLPDFIANAGGVICAAIEYAGASEAAAFAAIEEKLRHNTEQVLERMRREQILPRQAAMELAVERVKKAMSVRRFGLFSGAPRFV